MVHNIRLSADFKKQTTKAILSIALFAFTYLVIVTFAVALTAFCVYAGFMIIVNVPHGLTILLGAGLASVGFLILFFLLKFMFTSNKVDRSHLHEITEEDQPELFAMIEEIVTKVDTSFPRKVYLSAEVNAAVFYDSSFWSMFLPVKKNLQIGLGLVNSVTKEELKAILAHEFGHFSQKTMKVGSYVFNVNKVIYNMLYENDSYRSMMQSWANLSFYIYIFVAAAAKIITGIQWTLRQMYTVVNKSYLALSREMEFHADEVAANITGYEPLKTSLLRMNLVDNSFNNVLDFYEKRIINNYKSENIYKEQAFLLEFTANKNHVDIINHLPEVNTQELNRFNKSKLVIKNQWSSHPSTEERVIRLEKTGLHAATIDPALANTLFRNINALQEQITEDIFKKVQYKEEIKLISTNDFKEEYTKYYFDNSFSDKYNKYYDNKNPTPFNLSEAINIQASDATFPKLYSDQQVETIYTSIALEYDLDLLKGIKEGRYVIKTFDYDGIKYNNKQVDTLIQTLTRTNEELKAHIAQNDKDIFRFFTFLENDSDTQQLYTLYQKLFHYDDQYEARINIHTSISDKLQFIHVKTPNEEIIAKFRDILPLEEQLKDLIRPMLTESMYESELTTDIRNTFEQYLSQQHTYFSNTAYQEENLRLLIDSINYYGRLLSRGYFLLKKELLNYQLTLLPH